MNAQPSKPIPVLDYAPVSQSSTLYRWLWLSVPYLVYAALGAGTAAAIAWAVTPRYFQVQAQLYIQPPAFPARGTPGRSQVLYTAAATISSSPLINAAAQAAVASGSITSAQWAAASIDASLDRRTDLIRVRVRHPDAQSAPLIANEIVNAFVRSQTSAIATFEVPAPAATLQPQYDHRWIAIAAAFGLLLGPIIGLLVRQKR